MLPSPPGGTFGGAAIVDADGDGRTDLAAPNGLLLRRESGFERVLFEGQFPIGSVFGDVDGDARVDVLVLYGSEPEVFRYNPAREALDPFVGGGLGAEVPLVQGSVLFDYDRDGHLDALISDDGGMDQLYRGLGGGVFEERSELLPPLLRGDYGMMVADYDRDGDDDVYVGLCAGITENLLYRNEGGTFSDAAEEAGVDDERSSWGVAWFDFDNDGWLDIFVANMPAFDSEDGRNKLYRNNGDGTFTDVAEQAGVAGPIDEMSWTAAAADFDNDGWTDLFVVNLPQRSRLYRNEGDGTFTDITTAAQIPGLSGLPLAVGDVNDDGWVDLYVPESTVRRTDALLLNDGGSNGWLSVDLSGTASNPDGIGARVEVTAGELSMVREIVAGDGFMAHSHGLRAHFGLGTAATADVTIRWPSGAVETIAGVAANQAITVVEGAGIDVPPGMFALTTPTDGGAVPLGEPVTLAWEVPASDEPLSYTVYLAAPDGTDQTFETTEPTLTVPASAVAPEGTYRWAVVASDGHTPRTSLDPFRFTNDPGVANEAEPEERARAVAVWPNPTRGAATLRFEVEHAETLWFEVYDVLGRRTERTALGLRTAGSHTEDLDMSRRPAGVYVVRVVGSRSGVATTRLLRVD